MMILLVCFSAHGISSFIGLRRSENPHEPTAPAGLRPRRFPNALGEIAEAIDSRDARYAHSCELQRGDRMADLEGIDVGRARRIAERLVARKETIAVSESSAGGLISAALLSVPGASAYFLGGGIIYTRRAMGALLDLTPDKLSGLRSATEPIARLLAETIRLRLRADWGLAETGATGPTGNRYGDAAGRACLAVAGKQTASRTLETGSDDRIANMAAFANAALALLEETLALTG